MEIDKVVCIVTNVDDMNAIRINEMTGRKSTRKWTVALKTSTQKRTTTTYYFETAKTIVSSVENVLVPNKISIKDRRIWQGTSSIKLTFGTGVKQLPFRFK